jgi:integrase/recombinase XerD
LEAKRDEILCIAGQRGVHNVRMLSALRKLARMLSIGDYANPRRQAAYSALMMIKAPAEDTAGHERGRRALSAAEADQLLRVWQTDATPRGKRNQALLTVLLLAGLRREECAQLTWSDIDFSNGVIRVRHGKGDKARDVALFGSDSLSALTAWQMEQPTDYSHVFVALRKGGTFIGDSPMTATSIWRVVDEAAEKAGIGHVRPHDLRRTLITELLTTGSPLADVQAQAGHVQGSTTLRYAGAVDARQRRKSGRVRYG